MAVRNTIECWEVDPTDGSPSAAWMLVDPHRGGRVIACGGVTDFRIGDEILCEQIDLWMSERRRAGDSEIYLIPLGDEAWFVLTQFYLSSGLLLLTRLPAYAGDSLVLAQEGIHGEIAVFPGMAGCAVRARDFDPRPCKSWWRKIEACLPVLTSADAEASEMDRLLRAAAAVNGIRVGRAVICETDDEPTEIAEGRQDLLMLTVMLLSALSVWRQSGVSYVTPRYERIEEGLMLILTAKGIASDSHPEEADGMLFCREAAEQNGQIFTCTVHDSTMRMTLCAVRKDFALLGVKVDPPLS